jgi:hypothetical protein
VDALRSSCFGGQQSLRIHATFADETLSPIRYEPDFAA